MTSTLKNGLVILGLLTIGYAAYYFYTARESTTLDTGITDSEFQSMLLRTQAFIQLRQELNQMQLDVSFLEDSRFRSLESFEEPLVEVEAGRANPFAEVTSNN